MVTTDDREIDDAAAELLSQARGVCPDAFCALGRAHQLRLFRQALVLCRDSQRAEEVAAETLVEAWRSLARFDGTCRFSTWLYAIMLNRLRRARRRPQSRPIPISELDASESRAMEIAIESLADSQPGPDQSLRHQEQSAKLLEAIAELPDKHQRVLLLRFYEDASLLEIATAMELPVGTVKSRLHHALEKLRQTPAIVNLFREARNG